ncbi:uncharacterized protein [Periplaneta americana]|uniref:uncharacterized protein isoform X4 n=1 Tax=Periplaneta americana TaxID=6978 RepID=UPI0037E8A78C
MDVTNMEPEVDPLAVQMSDNTNVEEKKPLSEEGNLFSEHMIRIKEECVDQSYDITSDMKVEETQMPVNFHFVKCEPQEQSCSLDTVDGELILKGMSSPDAMLTERTLGTVQHLDKEVHDSKCLMSASWR